MPWRHFRSWWSAQSPCGVLQLKVSRYWFFFFLYSFYITRAYYVESCFTLTSCYNMFSFRPCSKSKAAKIRWLSSWSETLILSGFGNEPLPQLSSAVLVGVTDPVRVWEWPRNVAKPYWSDILILSQYGNEPGLWLSRVGRGLILHQFGNEPG